jgi:hypothetical protein
MGESTIQWMPAFGVSASPQGGSEPGGLSPRAGDGEHLTLLEVAHATGRNVELLRRWCVAGRVPCTRLGRDWFIARAALPQVDALPRRGVSDDQRRLDDRSVLSRELDRELEGCLEPGEQVRVIVLGVEASGLIATDRKALVVRDGVLVSSPTSKAPAVWPLASFRRVQLDQSSAAGALVITPADPDDRALVVLLARPQLARAEVAADALRGLIGTAESREADPDGQGPERPG